MPKKASRWGKGWRGVLIVGLVLVSLALLFRVRFLVTLVVGASMNPNLKSGDLLLVDKRAYRAMEPGRGDIVVGRVRSELIVKRVVAVPGERVEVRQGVLFVNGSRQVENQPILSGELDIGSGLLSKGKYAILGDNRTRPVGLSVYAVVAKDQILGKVVGDLKWGRDSAK